MSIKVKFCGITSLGDAQKAVLSGVNALGFVFFKNSRRCIDRENAKFIIENLPPFIASVGVFVNEDIEYIKECVELCGLSVIQLHGDEDVKYALKLKGLGLKVKLIKAIRVKDEESLKVINKYPVDAILLDSYTEGFYGGTGVTFDKSLIALAINYGRPIVLSGGLNADNVYDRIKDATPYAVDVSSGIESAPGKKDFALMQKFMAQVRRFETD